MTQREIIQDEAHAESLRHQRCGLAISMRVGKTRIALRNYQSHYFSGIRALVAAPNKPIFKSWKDEIAKMQLQSITKNLKYTTYRSLTKFNPQDYDIIYLDEYQSLKLVHDEFLKNFTGIIVGITGTIPPDYTDAGMMAKVYCPVVYRYTTDEAVRDGILNDYRIFIHLMDLGTNNNVRQTGKNGGVWWSSEQKIYDYWCEKIDNASTPKDRNTATIMLMKAMMEFPSKLEYAKILLEYIKHKVIVFANTKEQADELCQFSYHSDNPESENNLELLNSDIISKLSCVLQLNAGITIHELKACIVMHSYSNSSKLAQRIARCLGLTPDQTADMHILAYRNTTDVTWVLKALENFNGNKIQYIDSQRVINKVKQAA